MTALPWQTWAILSAVFAALTAILGKVGVAGINSDFATFFRTIVVVVALGALLVATGQLQPVSTLTSRNLLFLTLSGLATGASWLCYFRALQDAEVSRVAPIDKLSVVLVAIFAFAFLGERLSVANWLGVVLVGSGVLLLTIKSV